MSNIPISSLPVAVALDGSEYVPLVQGGTTRRATTAQISAVVGAAYVPITRQINTPLNSGLAGGGSLNTDLNLSLKISNLAEMTAPTGLDYLAINFADNDDTFKISPPNFYKTISSLTHKAVPAAGDQVPLYSLTDSAARYSTVSEILAAAGSLPAGGTTGQPLIKQSDADFDTEWATLPVSGGGTGAITLTSHGVLLGQGTSAVAASVAMTDGQLLVGQTGADPLPKTVTGDVTISAAGVTAIGTNKVTNAMLRQSVALSVIGNATNATANVADIAAASDFQILRRSGTSVGFGSINLASSNAVGSTILGPANGGTGVNNGTSTLTLGGSLTTVGAFASTFTMIGATSVTFPTSGTLATTAGAALPSVLQGDLLFGSATNVLSTLAKNTTATRYLSNTGASNNPAWSQINLANGVTGILPAANGGVSAEPVTQVTTASASISAGTTAVAVVRTSPTTTNLTLPSVASQGGLPIHIFDWSSSVTDHEIEITPNGSDTIMKAATYSIFSNAAGLAGITLYPSTTLGGWYIAP